MAGFDFVAPAYPALARLVFGDTLMESQSHFLSSIPEGSRVLLAGGGTGELLTVLDQRFTEISVDFVDISDKMISKAKQRKTATMNVHFIRENLLEWQPRNYDVIITPFFLDCFRDDQLNQLILTLRKSLNRDGLWLFTDFMPAHSLHHKLLTWTMYRFFRLTAGLDARKLPDFDLHFTTAGMELINRKGWMNNYIESRVYRPL